MLNWPYALFIGWARVFFTVFMLQFQHPGYGVDVRKRSIWDLYGDETVLKVTFIFIVT